MKIRNEQFLQNYSPSWFRMILSGKNFDPLIGRDDKEKAPLIYMALKLYHGA